MILKRIDENRGIVELKSISRTKPPKPKQPTLRELVLSNRELIMNVINRLDGIEDRLDNLVKKNNLIE
jgi:hypothetical protein